MELMAEPVEWMVEPVPLGSAKLGGTRGCRKSSRLDLRSRLSRKDCGKPISKDPGFERRLRWRKVTGKVRQSIFSSLLFSTEQVAHGLPRQFKSVKGRKCGQWYFLE